MKTSICVFLFASACLSAGIGFSQSHELKFTEVLGVDGITLGKINAITQDQYGFMWFSDQDNRSIIRYDGTHMKKYTYNPERPNDPNAPGGFYPECFFLEKSGIMWIGYYGQGLDRFDPLTQTFTHFRHDHKDPGSLSNDFVTSLIEDREGNLWVGTYSGLDLLDRQTGTFKNFGYKAQDSRSLSCDSVRTLYLDKSGNLWIGTGMAWVNDSRGGLNLFNKETKDFTRFVHEPDNPHSLIDNKVRAIFEDSKGNLWVGTRGDGLHNMDRKSGEFTRHTYDQENPSKLSRPPVRSAFDRITFIKEDAEGCIWIGTDQNGLNRYNPKTGITTHYDTVVDYGVWWMFVSNDDQLWISTNRNRLLKVNLYDVVLPFHAQRLDKVIKDSGIAWKSTNIGLIKEDETGLVKKYAHEPGNSNSLIDNEINRMLMDKQGKLWISTAFGLNKLDPKTDKITRFYHDQADTTNRLGYGFISSLLEDKNGDLWIGLIDGGLDKLERGTGQFVHYEYNPFSNGLNGSVVIDILEHDNAIWIGLVANRGLNRLDLETGKFSFYLQGMNVMELYTDSMGVLWVGTTTGLLWYDEDKNEFRETEIIKDIQTITEDEDKNLWVSTKQGLYRMNLERNHFIYFETEIEISVATFFENFGEAYTEDDTLKVANDFGYFAFRPQDLDIHPDTTQIHFSELWIANAATNAMVEKQSGRSLLGLNEIKLDNNQNIFSVSFVETDFQPYGENKIYYTLENYDMDWRETQSGEKVNYYKIPTGRYIMHIKAASSTGIWSEKSLAIIIAPPWWNTWWAYIFYLMLFSVMVLIVDRVQKARIVRKEREKIKDKELKQAREIEKAYTDLKATQTQLIQSEKMASLGELTAGIAHEIQNPLNFVNNFSEVSAELLTELKEELAKGNIGEASLISEDVIINLLKIHHHGQRASGIVKGMLEHSRTGNGVKELTDLNALADEYLRLAYHGLRAKDKSFNADFKTDFDEKLPKIQVVPQDIGRVLLNLINNAFFAVTEMKKRADLEGFKNLQGLDSYKPKVSVATKKEGNKILISVKDNGPGIPEEIKEKIFQPFFTTKPTGSGTGLGLSLSYDIVKAHGGTISVESRPAGKVGIENIGTEFIITLPL